MGGFWRWRRESAVDLLLARVTSFCVRRANFGEFSFFLVSPKANTRGRNAQLYERTEVAQN
jgi:hypothetical protein